MANEITSVCNVQVQNAQLTDQFMSSGQYNQIVAAEHPDVISAITSGTGTQVPIGVVTGGQEGLVEFQNLDQVNYADLGLVVSAAFQPFARLYPGANGKPGPAIQFWFTPGVTLWCKGHTLAPQIKMLLLQL